MNKSKKDLDSEKYLKRFWLCYSIILISLPCMKIIRDFIDVMDVDFTLDNISSIRTIIGYFSLSLLSIFGFLTMENAKMYHIETTNEGCGYSKRRIHSELKALIAFFISVATMIGVHYINIGEMFSLYFLDNMKYIN
ncbi:MAG: hypothetical protein KKC01_05805 [Gammaproteobacteria bacterium]|nr:hypothetical protein [Gammaproteobacteria bacterium]